MHLTEGAEVRHALRQRTEIGLLDVRPEGPFAEGHPLFAASFPLGRLEAEVLEPAAAARRARWWCTRRRGRTDAAAAAARLQRLGYRDVSLLDGGLAAGWPGRGAVPRRQRAEQGLRGAGRGHGSAPPPWPPANSAAPARAAAPTLVVVDARRFEEYHTMSIPTAHQRARRRAGHAGRRARPGPGHPGRRELRRPHPEHHRGAVADQRRAAEPGGGAAQRDHRLDAWPGWTLEHGQQRRAPGAAGHGPARAEAAPGRSPTRLGCGRIDAAALASLLDRGDAHRVPVRRPLPRGLHAQATWPGSGLRPAASWCRRPTGTPRSAEPSWCWPTMAAAGPR